MARRETRPVTFTRCGYAAAICIPRQPAMTSIFRPLFGGAAANKENTRHLVLEPPTPGHLQLRVLTIRLGTATATHRDLRHLISYLDKEAEAGHECRGCRHRQPAPTHPSSLHTHAHLELSLPCTASTCIRLCHQAICRQPQIFKRPVSFVVVRRGQSLPEGASMLRGQGADGCRRGSLSRQTHASPLLRAPELGPGLRN